MRIATPRRRTAPRGFSLIEAAMTTVIIGVGFVAMLQLLAAGSVSNVNGTELTTGINLAKNIREMTLQNTYASLPGLNGAKYSPPKDSRGTAVASMSDWEQVLEVKSVDPDRLTLQIIDSTPAVVRVTATINHSGSKVCDLTWYVFDGKP